MTQQWPPQLAPFAQRWTTFLDKVRARVTEIDAEARAGYAEVIAHDVVDGTGLSGVSSALKARLLQLSQKVDDQWSKIDGELDNVDTDGRVGGYFRGALLSQTSAFKHWLERETERMIVQGEAEAARALQKVAVEESKTPVPCQQCGAQLQGQMVHQASNISCPHCKAVSTIMPGTATAMYFAGAGALNLARERAWEAWCAMQDAEREWRRLRVRTSEDLQRWEGANRTYWQVFANAMGTLHPGWTPQHVENEVRGKMSWFMETTAKDEQTVRANNSAGLAAVASGDPNQLVGWLRAQRDPSGAAESMIEAAFERGWQQHMTWIAQVAAPVVAPGESGWAAEKVDEIAYYAATRGD